MNRLTQVFAVIAIAAMTLIAGCGGGGSGLLSTGTGMGTLAVHMVDAPVTGVTAVNVNITEVDAHVGNQWVVIGTPNQTYNLLDFMTHDVLLAQGPLPGGSYTQIRFIVDSANVVDGSGTHDLTIPSGDKTGIKVNVDYTIQANTITDVLLDFNLEQSLHTTGNGGYIFTPVVPASVITLSGTISGTVTDGSANPLQGAVISAVYASGTNYAVGTTVNTSVSQADGSFTVWTLLPGTYDLNISYTDPNTSAVLTATVLGVTVTAGNDTNVGSVAVTQPGSVSGAISNGAPVAGATVTATYTAGGNLPNGTVAGSTTSAADGSFSITNLPPGTYTIDASAASQTGSVTSVTVNPGADTPVGTITIA